MIPGSKRFHRLALAGVVLLSVHACSDDPTGPGPGGEDASVGYLYDGPVGGVAYDGGTVSGFTEWNGQFEFDSGEPVHFSFAGMDLGSVSLQRSGTVVTPLDLQGTSRAGYQDDLATVNLLRLLQTMDLDGDPGTRIRVIEPQHLEDVGLGDALAGVALDDPDFDAHVEAFLEELALSGLTAADEVVSAEEAIEHFERTLASLETDPAILGAWEIRTERFGEFGGILELDAGGTGSLVEYHGCTGSGAGSWVSTLARAQTLCSTEESYTVSWSLEGRTLTIDTGAFTDECTVLSGDVHRFSASCEIFDGERMVAETQHFIRTGVNGFDEDLIPGAYREFGLGSHAADEAASLSFSANGTGSYSIGDESGTFTWNVANPQTLELDIAGEGPVPPLEFNRYVAGALEYFEPDNSEDLVAIPNHRKWTFFAGVHRYAFDSGVLIEESVTVDSHESCPECGFPPSGTGEAFTSAEGPGGQQACRIIHQVPTIEGRGVFWMNCGSTDGSGAQAYEIWRRN